MEGRRVSRRSQKYNPLFILFMCMFAAVIVMLILSIVLSVRLGSANKKVAAATEQVEAPATEVNPFDVKSEVPLHQALKTKFIEGGAGFMSLIIICLIIGLALAIERILYLTFSKTNAKALVEKVEDANGLEAIKVTFNSGILFDTNKSDLKQASKNELSQFATKMSDLQDTDITIYGHTDNTGSDAVNERLSKERAQSVATYLKNCGIASSRMTTEGKSYSMPVADNSTKEGRAQNRRVEIYITANQKMIEAAENGTLE